MFNPRYVPPPATHASSPITVHPRSTPQHAPGHVIGPHAVSSPRHVPPPDEHAAADTTAHVPLGAQHAPGHVAAPHVVSSPRHVPPAFAHALELSRRHDPSTAQHAPTHESGPHAVSAPRNTPPCPTHSVTLPTTHVVPPLRQHAPAHVDAPHATSTPRNTPALAAQMSAANVAHVPSLAQQAPAHTVGVQLTSAPRNTPPEPTHAEREITRHVPSVAQHAPSQKSPPHGVFSPANAPPRVVQSCTLVCTHVPSPRQHAPMFVPTVTTCTENPACCAPSGLCSLIVCENASTYVPAVSATRPGAIGMIRAPAEPGLSGTSAKPVLDSSHTATGSGPATVTHPAAHVVPAPRNRPPHVSNDVTSHVASIRQHAPTAAPSSHVPSHAVPAPRKYPNVQLAASSSKQNPVGVQHAPSVGKLTCTSTFAFTFALNRSAAVSGTLGVPVVCLFSKIPTDSDGSPRPDDKFNSAVARVTVEKLATGSSRPPLVPATTNVVPGCRFPPGEFRKSCVQSAEHKHRSDAKQLVSVSPHGLVDESRPHAQMRTGEFTLFSDAPAPPANPREIRS